MEREFAKAQAMAGGSVLSNRGVAEYAMAAGIYHVTIKKPHEALRDKYIQLRTQLEELLMDTKASLKKEAEILRISNLMESMIGSVEKVLCPNAVMTEGKNAALTHLFKGSAYTAVAMMGLIGNTSYTAPDAADVASAINTAASANGWNEATSGVSAARKDLTTSNQFGTPSAGSVSTSAQSFSITGTDTINGIFILIKSAAGVNPTTAVANTSGAIWSGGAFSGGGKAVANGDTLSVTYTTGL